MTSLHAQNFNWEPRITRDEQVKFVQICLDRAGANTMITPREMLRDYMTLLNILMQNPTVDFNSIVGATVTLRTDSAPSEEAKPETPSQHTKFDPADIDF